jgi:hypothetical protein
MRATRALVVVVGGLLVFGLTAGALAAPPLLTSQVGEVAFEVEPSPAARLSFAACAEVVRLLAQRGWETNTLRIRIQVNPFDATAPSADLVLDAAAPGDSTAFELAAALVDRQLRLSANPAVARLLAETVAAHLSAPGTEARTRWERAWLERLGRGEVLTTALPEVLWRNGADAAIRRAARGEWPESALAALTALGTESPLRAVGEVAVAGLLDPPVLGFHRPSIPEFAPAITQSEADVRFRDAGMRIVKLSPDADAVAVVPVRSERAEGWVAVRYALTGAFDVVPLNPRAEVTVPVRGVAWTGVIVVGLEPDARVSLALRPVSDYPVKMRRWDFEAGDTNVTLTWETRRHEGLRAFVVEALASGTSGAWRVLRRTVVPVASEGDSPFGYTYVEEGTEDAAAYRLLALTTDGFLTEVGSFPLRATP